MASPILTFFFSVECGNLPAAASGYTECAKTALENEHDFGLLQVGMNPRYVFSGTNVYTIRTLKCVDKPKVLQRYQPFTSFRCLYRCKVCTSAFQEDLYLDFGSGELAWKKIAKSRQPAIISPHRTRRLVLPIITVLALSSIDLYGSVFVAH